MITSGQLLCGLACFYTCVALFISVELPLIYTAVRGSRIKPFVCLLHPLTSFFYLWLLYLDALWHRGLFLWVWKGPSTSL